MKREKESLGTDDNTPDDLLRHLQDLCTGTYEGVQSQKAKEELCLKGILTAIVELALHLRIFEIDGCILSVGKQ